MSLHRFSPCPTRPFRATCYTCLNCVRHVFELPPQGERYDCGPRPTCDSCPAPAVIHEHSSGRKSCWQHFVSAPVTDLAPFVGRPRLRVAQSEPVEPPRHGTDVVHHAPVRTVELVKVRTSPPDVAP